VRRGLLVVIACAFLAIPSAGAARKAALPSHPLAMGIIGADQLDGAEAPLALKRLRSAGMSAVVTQISWPTIAPQSQPAEWNPADPGDPNYNWSASDARIKRIVDAGFVPILVVADAPIWTHLVPSAVSAPRADALGQFMRAAAQRYSGTYNGLPRVRYWEIWNEPNISLYFLPQFDPSTKKFVSPEIYRDMVNAAAASIHGVHADNIVIAGSTAPFRDITPEVKALDSDWGPLKFMRQFLCLNDAGKPTCGDSVSFDVWATHPYTSGGPTHHAALPYDVSLGDLPKMVKTLRAAQQAGKIKSAGRVRFWVNEFSWDSSPPDKCSPPMALLKRWIPEAFYRMWASGVDLIAWFLLMDQPPTASFYQSGLYFYGQTLATAKAKPYLEAFRFPFVALRRGRTVYVWAHTPFGRRAPVLVEQRTGRRWQPVSRLRTDRYGIAQAVLRLKPVGEFRAVYRSEHSLPFSMSVPRDQFFNPFGMTTLLEPNGHPNCSS
jgi:hypothetical protein